MESPIKQSRLKVLLISPYFDRNSPGESLSTYKWVEGICKQCDVTVLTTHKKGWEASGSPTQAIEIVNWVDPRLPKFMSRLDWELKPGYLLFYFRARRWIRKQLKAGITFDIIHQTNPVAMRYPCPAQGLPSKLIVGPFGGGLSTPPGFSGEKTDRQWFRKLRNIDQLRYRRDPWLRASYEKADLFIGVAPYVRDLLRHLSLRRFEVISEAGADPVVPRNDKVAETTGPLKLLFVGRIIRTKGVIDAIRAVAVASKTTSITFDVIGDGDALESCKAEAHRLNMQETIRFHGRRPRTEVLSWYERSHVFLFPSFREPSGHVVVEAMQYGLPVITSTQGGPGYFVNDECGVRVRPDNPEQYVQELAHAIVKIASDPHMRSSMSAAAMKRISDMVSWDKKMARLLELYMEIVGSNQNASGKT